jgi:hypothetical protein
VSRRLALLGLALAVAACGRPGPPADDVPVGDGAAVWERIGAQNIGYVTVYTLRSRGPAPECVVVANQYNGVALARLERCPS